MVNSVTFSFYLPVRICVPGLPQDGGYCLQNTRYLGGQRQVVHVLKRNSKTLAQLSVGV